MLPAARLMQPRADTIEPTLLPPRVEGWGVETTADLESVLPKADVVYLLRMQLERGTGGTVPTLREYSELSEESQRVVERMAEAADAEAKNDGN